MPSKTPDFWYKKSGLYAYALLPFSWLYRIGFFISKLIQPTPYKSSIPVICIGNAVAGGSGKTPTAIALMQLIQENNLAQTPVFLTRGYGGKHKDAFVVELDNYDVNKAGDEAYLLAQQAITIVSTNRADGARKAEEINADLIIMDDGLFNNTLHKDTQFLVVDRSVDFGNGKVMPAGPLRAPLKYTLPKVSAVIAIGERMRFDRPVFAANILPEDKKLNGDYIAFSGLGRPQKFFDTLSNLSANVIERHSFPDHHAFTAPEIETLIESATIKNATLITTEKDHIRIADKFKDKIKTLPITLSFNDDNEVINYLKASLK